MKKIIMVAGVLALFSGVASAADLQYCPNTIDVTLDADGNVVSYAGIPAGFTPTVSQKFDAPDAPGTFTIPVGMAFFNLPANKGNGSPSTLGSHIDCSYSPKLGYGGVDIVSNGTASITDANGKLNPNWNATKYTAGYDANLMYNNNAGFTILS